MGVRLSPEYLSLEKIVDTVPPTPALYACV